MKITTVAAAGISFAKRTNREWYGNTQSILCYAVVHRHAAVMKITTVAAAGISFAKRTNSEWYGNTRLYSATY